MQNDFIWVNLFEKERWVVIPVLIIFLKLKMNITLETSHLPKEPSFETWQIINHSIFSWGSSTLNCNKKKPLHCVKTSSKSTCQVQPSEKEADRLPVHQFSSAKIAVSFKEGTQGSLHITNPNNGLSQEKSLKIIPPGEWMAQLPCICLS